MEGFIGFLIIAGIGVFIAILAFRHRKKVLENWRLAAESLGLSFNDGGMMLPSRITGSINGHDVLVKTATRGSGKNSKTVTEYNVRYRKPINFKFSLTKQNFLHAFGKMFGMQDIEVGDKSFDDSVIVQGDNDSQIRDFLTAPRRKHIKLALSSFKEIKISHTGVEVATYGMESSMEKLRSTINSLCAMAEVIDPSRGTDHPIEKVKKARENGDISQAIEIIAATEGLNEDESIEMNEIEGEIRYVGGDTKRASEIFDKITENIEDDEHSKQWKRLADESKPIAPPPLPTTNVTDEEASITPLPAEKPQKSDSGTDATQSATTTAAQSSPLSLAEFCDTIFAKDLGAFDSSKLFDTEYKGKTVNWTGKLISASQFSFDFVFKDSPGVKATYEIFDIKSAYSTTKVKAIVRYPEERLEELKEKIGSDNIEFSGELLSLDGLTKNIFIC